jgi:hypothetical protein
VLKMHIKCTHLVCSFVLPWDLISAALASTLVMFAIHYDMALRIVWELLQYRTIFHKEYYSSTDLFNQCQ